MLLSIAQNYFLTEKNSVLCYSPFNILFCHLQEPLMLTTTLQFNTHLSYFQMHTTLEHQRKLHLILLKCLRKTVKASWCTPTGPCAFCSEERSRFHVSTIKKTMRSPLEETLKTFHPTWLWMKTLGMICGSISHLQLTWALPLKWKMFLLVLTVVLAEVLVLQEAVSAFLATLELTVILLGPNLLPSLGVKLKIWH